MSALTLRVADQTVTVRVDPDGVVRVGDEQFRVVASAPGLYVVDDGERRWQVAVAAAGEKRWVSVEGQVAVLEAEASGGSPRRRKGGAAESMVAPMPATVVKVLVAQGQTVAEGDVVLVLEAMKMELSIRAPRSGTVAAIRCTPGELVQPGVPLAELE